VKLKKKITFAYISRKRLNAVTRWCFALIAMFWFTKTASAALRLYEGFDYTPVNDQTAGALDGKNGGTGWGDAWVNKASDLFVYDSNGNPTNLYGGTVNSGLPDWDGVIDDVLQKGGYVGNSDWVTYRSGSYRLLSTNAAALAAADGDTTLWASVVWHWPGPVDGENNKAKPAFLLLSGPQVAGWQALTDSVDAGLGTAAGYSASVGDWTRGFACPVAYTNSRYHVAATDTSATSPTTDDTLIILKYVFGALEDTVSIAFFNETDIDALDETTFNASAASLTTDIDESSLTYLSITAMQSRQGIDEIRIGDSFVDVLGKIPPSGTVIVVK
jgi:hypothetical protein